MVYINGHMVSTTVAWSREAHGLQHTSQLTKQRSQLVGIHSTVRALPVHQRPSTGYWPCWRIPNEKRKETMRWSSVCGRRGIGFWCNIPSIIHSLNYIYLIMLEVPLTGEKLSKVFWLTTSRTYWARGTFSASLICTRGWSLSMASMTDCKGGICRVWWLGRQYIH